MYNENAWPVTAVCRVVFPQHDKALGHDNRLKMMLPNFFSNSKAPAPPKIVDKAALDKLSGYHELARVRDVC